MTWKERAIMAIDVETTGLTPGEDKIVELGVAVLYKGEIVKRHSRLINPGIHIPEEVSKIHGITDADVANAPSIEDIAEDFVNYANRAATLTAYNWPFDSSFLSAEIGDAWEWVLMTKPHFDTLTVVRFDSIGRYWKGMGRHKLEKVAERLGVAEEEAHRTEADCVMTLRVLKNLFVHLPDDIHEMMALCEKEAEIQRRNYEAWKARKNP
jgi:DNA polymerase III epsilon subunit family exonuclease